MNRTWRKISGWTILVAVVSTVACLSAVSEGLPFWYGFVVLGILVGLGGIIIGAFHLITE